MSKKKVKTLLEIEADFDMNPRGTGVRIEIVSTNGCNLTAQAIVDAVVDMASAYFGMTDEEWASLNEEPDSGKH